jgi:putative DNA primase/helicase
LTLSQENGSSVSISNELLADIQQVFESKNIDKISSADLITALTEDEEAPWATFNRGKPISPRQLAKYLDMYGIKSKTVRMQSGTPKGYDWGQFRDAFARYLTPPADSIQLENLPQRRNVSPQPMPAMDSGVAAETQPIRNGTPASETPQNGKRNETDTPEPLPDMACGVVADVAATTGGQEYTSLDDVY